MSLQEALNEIEEFTGLKAYACAAETEAHMDVYPRNGWVSFKDKRENGVAIVFNSSGIMSIKASKDDGRKFDTVWIAETCTETVQSPA